MMEINKPKINLVLKSIRGEVKGIIADQDITINEIYYKYMEKIKKKI